MTYWTMVDRRFKRRLKTFCKNNRKFKMNYFSKDIIGVIESYIELKGHAWCMDVSSERKKMAKLIFNLLEDIKSKS